MTTTDSKPNNSSSSNSNSALSTEESRAFQSALESTTDDSVPIGLYWDEWSRCVSSGYQMDSLYRNGKIDGCSKQWKDLKLAAEARLVQWRNPQKAQKLIASTYYTKRTTISPTAGAIWELKEEPGWN